MLSSIIAFAVDFVRNDDGRTAVEYAIAVNLLVIVAIMGLTVSGHGNRRTITKIGNGVASAYVSTHDTVYSWLRRTRGTPPTAPTAGASNMGRH